ncbi:cytochrome P450 [Geodermatophilus sabuli]|uniref:Cytochrome P450 n=1 Tax=Geodermatophilus sabuli TaxID=1564158 RepID=A0A7K3W0Q1_9ACTN|nr:cytochrome P450 [Geodermatophilus sabuli]NEK58435.1 cytochrome P450 [Geodermatophilus sabuli]
MSADQLTETPQLTLSTFAELWDGFRQRDLRQRLYDAGGVVMRDALLDLHGDAHKLRRRVENRLFRRGTFRFWEDELVPRIIDEAFAPSLRAGRGDLVQLGYRTTMNLTARVAGADHPTGSVEETDALQQFAVTFSEGATLVHSTRDHAQVRAEVEEALGRFDAMFFTPSYERRRALAADPAVPEDELPRDVLMAMVRNADELGADRTVMLREVAFYLQAGSHSTSDAFTHAADEILRWRQRHPDLAGRLGDDRFVQRCVHEVFRLHPASPVAERRALADVTLRDGRVVPAGTVVVMDIRAANRDPEVFGADAEEFDPLRTVPDGVPPWGHTFGGGMHACIGMELDGGTVPRDEAGGGPDHVLGTVPLMVRELLRHGVRPDPDHPPTKDPHSKRDHFGTYPVLFDPS